MHRRKQHSHYTLNLNPWWAASPGKALMAPSTKIPCSSFLFNRTSMKRNTTAAMMAMKEVAQLTDMAIM